jgi:predicted nucleotide-binding protein (sugar kinase/HSP70/actin superfamily)
MNVAFPYMGTVPIALGALLRALGARTVIPPPPDASTLQTGVRLAPEQMCIPFKLTLGNLARALDMGADTIAYSNGTWQCRYGYYSRLHRNALRALGHRYEIIMVRGDDLSGLVRRLVKLSGGSYARALLRAGQAFRIGWLKSSAVEEVESLARWYRPRETRTGTTNQRLRHYLSRLDAGDSPAVVSRLRRQARESFAAIETEPERQPLRVKVVGESFSLLEPYVNLNVLERLGSMGVWADPFLTAHRWLGFHSLRIGNRDRRDLLRPARAYWRYGVGGEDENVVAYTLQAARDRYDGVLHLHPFGCMPETVVRPVLQQISREHDLPLLSISLDEHTAEAGFYTRIEAFLAVLEQRRKLRVRNHDDSGRRS